MIDYEKFKDKEGEESKILKECMNYGESREFISAKFTFVNKSNGKEIETYYNKVSYDKWLPFTFDEKYLNFNGQRYIIVRDGENEYPGKIEYSIVTPSG